MLPNTDALLYFPFASLCWKAPNPAAQVGVCPLRDGGCLCTFLPIEGKNNDWENGEPPAVEDQVWKHLRNPKVNKSTGPDEMHLRILRELAEEDSKPLSIIFEKMCQSCEIPTERKRENISLLSKGGKKKTWGTTGQAVSEPVKIMEHILLETTRRHMIN